MLKQKWKRKSGTIRGGAHDGAKYVEYKSNKKSYVCQTQAKGKGGWYLFHVIPVGVRTLSHHTTKIRCLRALKKKIKK